MSELGWNQVNPGEGFQKGADRVAAIVERMRANKAAAEKLKYDQGRQKVTDDRATEEWDLKKAASLRALADEAARNKMVTEASAPVVDPAKQAEYNQGLSAYETAQNPPQLQPAQMLDAPSPIDQIRMQQGQSVAPTPENSVGALANSMVEAPTPEGLAAVSQMNQANKQNAQTMAGPAPAAVAPTPQSVANRVIPQFMQQGDAGRKAADEFQKTTSLQNTANMAYTLVPTGKMNQDGTPQMMLIDNKGKPVSGRQAETTGDQINATEAGKLPWRRENAANALELQDLKGDISIKIAGMRKNGYTTDAQSTALTEMALKGALPANVNSRTAPILADVWLKAKAQGKEINFNTLKTDVAAQNKIKQMVGLQEVNSSAFEKHITRFENLYDQLGSSSIPVFNKVVNAIQKNLGAPEGDAAAAVLYESMMEYAKVMSGQTTGQAVTDTAASKANELLAVANSPEQVKLKLTNFRGMVQEKVAAGHEIVGSFTLNSVTDIGGNKPAAKGFDKTVVRDIVKKQAAEMKVGDRRQVQFVIGGVKKSGVISKTATGVDVKFD